MYSGTLNYWTIMHTCIVAECITTTRSALIYYNLTIQNNEFIHNITITFCEVSRFLLSSFFLFLSSMNCCSLSWCSFLQKIWNSSYCLKQYWSKQTCPSIKPSQGYIGLDLFCLIQSTQYQGSGKCTVFVKYLLQQIQALRGAALLPNQMHKSLRHNSGTKHMIISSQIAEYVTTKECWF